VAQKRLQTTRPSPAKARSRNFGVANAEKIGGGGGGRGGQSRRAEQVRAANAARAKAAHNAAVKKASAQAAAQKDADRAAARQRYNAEKARQASIAAANQRAQEAAQEKNRIQATIRAAEKKEATRQANIAAVKKASAQAAAQKDAARAVARQKYYAEKARQANISAANKADKYGVTPTSMTHKNDADGINVADLDKSKTYIIGRPVDGLGALGVNHSAQLYYNGKTKEWDTLAAHNLNGNRLTSEFGLDADEPHLPGQVVLGTVNTGHMSNQAYIERMINTDGGYNDDAEYDAIPSLTAGQGWNCNGYTMGMIDHLGATVTPFDGRDVSSLTGADTRFNFSN
jgi:hypothetical protein